MNTFKEQFKKLLVEQSPNHDIGDDQLIAQSKNYHLFQSTKGNLISFVNNEVEAIFDEGVTIDKVYYITHRNFKILYLICPKVFYFIDYNKPGVDNKVSSIKDEIYNLLLNIPLFKKQMENVTRIVQDNNYEIFDWTIGLTIEDMSENWEEFFADEDQYAMFINHIYQLSKQTDKPKNALKQILSLEDFAEHAREPIGETALKTQDYLTFFEKHGLSDVYLWAGLDRYNLSKGVDILDDDDAIELLKRTYNAITQVDI